MAQHIFMIPNGQSFGHPAIRLRLIDSLHINLFQETTQLILTETMNALNFRLAWTADKCPKFHPSSPPDREMPEVDRDRITVTEQYCQWER